MKTKEVEDLSLIYLPSPEVQDVFGLYSPEQIQESRRFGFVHGFRKGFYSALQQAHKILYNIEVDYREKALRDTIFTFHADATKIISETFVREIKIIDE